MGFAALNPSYALRGARRSSIGVKAMRKKLILLAAVAALTFGAGAQSCN